MKKLILLAFMLIANVFAGELQEAYCDDKSLSYCINHFDRQCEAKKYGACWIVGALYEEQEQYSKTKKYLEMVCDNANSKDSYEVESIDGGVWEIPATMFMGFMGTACSYLGRLYSDGTGVRQSYEKAFHYYKKACNLGNGNGCGLLGVMYRYGEGVKQNLPKAKELFGKACDLGNQIGCDGYKKLKEKGY